MSLQTQLNRYDCQECKGHIITIDSDEGVTPFMLGCRATPGCKGMMRSAFYRGITGAPTFEWRKPTDKELSECSLGMLDHFMQGGLDIHPLQQSPHADRGVE
jgi:hypothetical protein